MLRTVPALSRHNAVHTTYTIITTVTLLAWTVSSFVKRGDVGEPIRQRVDIQQPAATATVAAAPSARPKSAARSDAWNRPPRIVDPPLDNPLWAAFKAQTKGPVIRKWSGYFDIYQRYFHRFRGRKVNFLEIGVQSGGSISLWQTYFGADKLTYYGVDINLYCQELYHDPPRVNILIGDQGSREWWASFREQAAAANLKFDIILDDGGHEMQMQIVTYEEAWPMLKDGGVYICEDTSTSMDTIEAFDYSRGPPRQPGTPTGPRWHGGWRKRGTWIEYAKNFADTVNGHYVNQTLHPRFDPLKRQHSVLSAAMYDQMVVLEKGQHPPAKEVWGGVFLMPIGQKLADDGKVIPELLDQYRKELAASLA